MVTNNSIPNTVSYAKKDQYQSIKYQYQYQNLDSIHDIKEITGVGRNQDEPSNSCLMIRLCPHADAVS